jgi:hypothetical protein
MRETADLGCAKATNTAAPPTFLRFLQTPEQLSCVTCLRVVSCHHLLQRYLLMVLA